MIDELFSDFYEMAQSLAFEPYGILDSSDRIYTLGTDSKIIGRIFEMFVQPILENIAIKHGMVLETPSSQTTYPDFILSHKDKKKNKIAIDVKTTYRNSPHDKIGYTLGSYGSYMRNNVKNIEYTYDSYDYHLVIGFVYYRNDSAQSSNCYLYENRSEINFPFFGVEYFIQEKYKIAGEKPGSGNTENIGSFPTSSIDDLKNGVGPFSRYGKDIYDIYWKYYPKYRSVSISYRNLDEFFAWLVDNIDEVHLFHEIDRDKILKRAKRLYQKAA